MAAYAALVSLMHTIDQIQLHPRPPISLDKTQVESLTEKVTFLQEFLEGYSQVGYSNEPDALEIRIADAAYAAEYKIESHIADQVVAESTSHGEKISSIDFYQGLQEVIEDMDFIKKEVMQMKEKIEIQDQLHKNSPISAGSLRSSSTEQNGTTVGQHDVLYEVMDKLTGGEPNRHIIPIVGMGGIGKTTLARNIYESRVIMHHFDILAWVTVSQEYIMREILLELILSTLQSKSRESLSQISEDEFAEMLGIEKSLSELNEFELGNILHKRLSGRRYLVIIDDIWKLEVWDQLKFFFPNNNNGSRIMLTTRISNLAFQIADCRSIEMGFLDKDESWILFCKKVFGEGDCPPEMMEIGKKIADNCKGLPLSIIVIGGLLAKSQQTQQFWEYIVEHLNSIVNSEDNERCLQILYMSYNSLPIYLKPCFLYMGVFRKDSEIHAFDLIQLWVAEGFLKISDGKNFEEVAEQYLRELIDRNLILIEQYNSYGKIKLCKIHDLLRDLCLREARKQKFLCVLKAQTPNSPQGSNKESHICIDKATFEEKCHARIFQASESASLPLSLNFVFQQVNLRYIAMRAQQLPLSVFPPSVSLLWNLQILICSKAWLISAPSEIWMMSQLRHVQFWSLRLPNPLNDGQDDIVLENLQTLLFVHNLRCCKEVVKKIPNIKKLKLYYEDFKEGSPYCINNLGHLHKLESLGIAVDPFPNIEKTQSYLVQNLTFPHSLKKLTLRYTHLHWENMTTKIGSLPLLEILKLKFNSFIGSEWKTVEGQFCSLKFLLIEFCDLEYWTTDSTHFPRLEHLVLQELPLLKEIDLSIGDIPTLQSIQLGYNCSKTAIDSAKRIQEEQEELGNDDLKVQFPSFWS